ncbi:hypothetical protein [Emticicia agri]|uniref:Uncharacterized protein n=1 Tax=Emticicia agri TaxID=2492393 RepID=A0A4Q5LU72_9BACT|nr:hypothetical protein [Emticicia agri]RYU93019.1 hypothetical protein EWM59_24200 [Emticicia agri]
MIKSMSNEFLNEAFKNQKKDIGWDFYAERQFIENLFCQRFNYLIAIYAIIIAGAGSAKNQFFLNCILCIGFIVVFLLSLVLYRAYIKLIILLKILHRLESHHVFPIIETEMKQQGKTALFGVNSLIGVYIPVFFNLTILIGLILSLGGCLKA